MTILKRNLTASLACLLALAAPLQGKDWTRLRVAIEAGYPPFNTLSPDKQIGGFDKDIADAVCAQIQARCTFVIQDWDGMVPGLLARRYDTIISSMAPTDERRRRIAFTRPYYVEPIQFIARRGGALDVDHPAAMKGKRIGVQSATIFENYVKGVYQPAGALPVVYQSLEQVYLDLVAGRLDAVLVGKPENDAFLQSADGAAFVPAGRLLYDAKWFGVGAAIAVRREDQDLRRALDDAIVAIHKDGRYDAIRRKYFSYDIWPGE
jgi:ABC-type amino acid transport substrate-binding protein